ncbi:MAG: hypothetical protein AAFR27_01340 [Pseudomonadota bacterium]
MKFAFKTTAASAIILGSTVISQAGPEGLYNVDGTNPDGSTYTGTVSVERNDETYSVEWKIGGTIFEGTGLGAAPVKGMTIMGPAADNDYVLTVGYISGPQNFGIAYYIEQDDGKWQGIWAFGGSGTVATESWRPVE